MRIRLTRAIAFRAHHRLADAAASADANRRRFGWTAESHPHHYRVEVTVTGPVAEREAMVVDLPLLDTILHEEVTARLDGRHLDRDVPELAGILPTCEALARHLFGRVATRLPAGVALARVMVAEDASLQAECLADS